VIRVLVRAERWLGTTNEWSVKLSNDEEGSSESEIVRSLCLMLGLVLFWIVGVRGHQ
jgi:hypothetical protein